LKLIVGNGQLTDSFGMDDVDSMSSDQIPIENSKDIGRENRTVSKPNNNTKIDESFF
jgi:hypothetical protein